MLSQFSKQVKQRHLVVWTCVMFNFIFLSSISGSLISKFVWISMLMIIFSSSYYTLLLYIWPNLFEKRKIYFLLVFAVLVFLFILIYTALIEIIVPYLGGKTALYGKPFDFKIPKFLINFSYITFASVGSYFNWLGVKRVEDAEVINQNAIELELMILKSQFHSHLTFNFLNYCYNKVRIVSSETAISIEEFSFMLRYSLKEGGKKLICLQKEVEYIENFISFQKCLINDFYVEFKYEGELSLYYILPKILIVFVENAFKHGVLNNPETPVKISVQSYQNEIFFSIQNHKSHQRSFIESGIGIKNVRQILEIFYSENHSLKISETESLFLCELSVKNNLSSL